LRNPAPILRPNCEQFAPNSKNSQMDRLGVFTIDTMHFADVRDEHVDTQMSEEWPSSMNYENFCQYVRSHNSSKHIQDKNAYLLWNLGRIWDYLWSKLSPPSTNWMGDEIQLLFGSSDFCENAKIICFSDYFCGCHEPLSVLQVLSREMATSIWKENYPGGCLGFVICKDGGFYYLTFIEVPKPNPNCHHGYQPLQILAKAPPTDIPIGLTRFRFCQPGKLQVVGKGKIPGAVYSISSILKSWDKATQSFGGPKPLNLNGVSIMGLSDQLAPNDQLQIPLTSSTGADFVNK